MPVGGLRERKKARTHEAIVRAAIELFERQGYDETTVEEIAAAADVSPRTFFRYFDSKVDVIFPKDDDHSDFDAAFATRPTGESVIETVHQMLREKLALLFEEDGALAIRQHRLAFQNPSLRTIAREHVYEGQDDLARALAKALGAAPDALQPRLMAAAIGGTLWTVFERWAEAKNSTAEDLIALVDEAFELLERGLP
ncbi:MAG: TetR family transcriptional regulator [Acidimicrobiia bacterium]